MSFSINSFAGALKLGGARSSLFQVTISNPVSSFADIQVPFMVKSATIPSSTLSMIEVPYFGRKIKLAGNRTFEEWQVSVLNDEDFAIRNALEAWSNAINGVTSNLNSVAVASPALYKSTAQVTQFSKTGVPIRVYNLIGLWPQTIGQIDLNWETEGVQEFPVTFSYDYYEVSGGITGSGT